MPVLCNPLYYCHNCEESCYNQIPYLILFGIHNSMWSSFHVPECWYAFCQAIVDISIAFDFMFVRYM
jgi:hypothetical protein